MRKISGADRDAPHASVETFDYLEPGFHGGRNPIEPVADSGDCDWLVHAIKDFPEAHVVGVLLPLSVSLLVLISKRSSCGQGRLLR